MSDDQSLIRSLADAYAPEVEARVKLTEAQITEALEPILRRLEDLEREIEQLRAGQETRDADTPADTFDAADQL